MSKTGKHVLYCISCYILMYILLSVNYIKFDNLGSGLDEVGDNFVDGVVYVIAPVSLPVWLIVKNIHDVGEIVGDL